MNFFQPLSWRLRRLLFKVVEFETQRNRLYARAIFARPDDPGVRVVIFAQGRSGTTVLESLICSTGLFVPNDEPLIGLGRGSKWPTAYVKGFSRDPTRQGPGGNFICHVKPDHLDKHRVQSGQGPADISAFVSSLVRDRWYVVHVHREDIVRQVLSNMVAKARGHWHKRDDRPETLTIHVGRDEFLAGIRYRKAMRVREQGILTETPHLSLVYERDLLDPASHERTVDAVLKHVGLARAGPVFTELRKINARPLNEIVENYEEFTGWVEELKRDDRLLAPDPKPG